MLPWGKGGGGTKILVILGMWVAESRGGGGGRDGGRGFCQPTHAF